MRYALWNLKQEIDNYLSGPEQIIADNGGRAEGIWTDGNVEEGATILGYVFGDFNIDLSAWNYREIDVAEAMAFCQEIEPSASLINDGRIVG